MEVAGHSLTLWLRLSYAAVVLATAAALALLINRHLATVLEADERDRVQTRAQLLAERFDEALDERLGDVRLLALLPSLRSAQLDKQDVYPFLESLAEHEPDYAWIGFADASGRVLVATDGLLEGADVSKRPWFIGARHRPYLGGAHEAALLAKLLKPEPDGQPLRFIDVAAPVYADNGRLLGVVGGHLSVRWADRIEEQLSRQATNMGAAEVLITDPSDLVLVGPGNLEGQSLPPSARGYSSDGAYLGATATTAPVASGRGLGWTVQVRTPRDQALEGIAQLRATILAGSALLAVLAIFGAALLARHVAAPLVRLADAARRMREDRSIELPATASYAEAHELYAALGGLLTDLKGREGELLDMAAGLEETVTERTRALEKANAALEQLSMTDPLTGAYNRRKFDQAMAFELDRASEQGLELALMVVDIDHFKRINDTHGHPIGDRVLAEVASILQACLRPSDVLARIGGEEFAVLAPGAAGDRAGIIAERMRATIEARSPLRIGRNSVDVTVSIGVACISLATHSGPGGALVTRLYCAADEALYSAKARGRNRAVVAAELVA